MARKSKLPSVEAPTDTPSVAADVLAEFVKAIDAEQGILPGVGDRLKRALLEDHDFSESAIRQALFGDATL